MIPQQNVSILIPAYNEQSTILKVLRKLVQLEIALHEIIIVDDGSTDGTAERVEQWLAGNSEQWLAGNSEQSLAGKPKIRLIRQPRNMG